MKGTCERCGEPFESKLSRAKFCSRNCQKRAWDARPQPCARCGGLKSRKSEHCRKCEHEIRHAASEARLEDIALMWEAGMSAVAIAHELGYGLNSTPPQLSELMRRGRIQARREGFRRKHAER